MQGESTHGDASVPEAQFLEGIDLIAKADLHIQHTGSLASVEPLFLAGPAHGRADAYKQCRKIMILEIFSLRHLLYRLHAAKQVDITEGDRRSRQKRVQLLDNELGEGFGVSVGTEVHIAGHALAFEGQRHDRTALQYQGILQIWRNADRRQYNFCHLTVTVPN